MFLRKLLLPIAGVWWKNVQRPPSGRVPPGVTGGRFRISQEKEVMRDIHSHKQVRVAVGGGVRWVAEAWVEPVRTVRGVMSGAPIERESPVREGLTATRRESQKVEGGEEGGKARVHKAKPEKERKQKSGGGPLPG